MADGALRRNLSAEATRARLRPVQLTSLLHPGPMSLSYYLAPLVATLVLAGCGSAPKDDDGSGGGGTSSSHATTSAATGSSTGGNMCLPPASQPAFELGTGETCFEELASLQTLIVNQGPQGGFHLWTAIGCADCGSNPTVEYGIQDPATNTWYAESYPTKLALDLSGGWPQQAGLTAFLPGVVYDVTTQLPKGTHVVLYARVIAPDGSTLHEQGVEVVLGDTVQWNPPCDSNPMTCGLPGGQPCCSFGGDNSGG
jgi:hypothetical protein